MRLEADRSLIESDKEKWFKPAEIAQECNTFYGSKGKSIRIQNYEIYNTYKNLNAI